MVLNVHKKTKTKNNNKTIRPIRDGEKGGKGGLKVGEEGDDTPIAIHCHHQNDSCIKMGSDESHFNVSVRSDVILLLHSLHWLPIHNEFSTR